MIHIPVLLKEVIQYLEPKPNQNFIDCTVDGGGHSLAILKRTSPDGKVLGIDLDEAVIKDLQFRIENQEFKKRLILVHDNFANLKKIVEENNFELVRGILLDLGMSSEQIEKSGRGFSFMKDEKLDMRFDFQKNQLTAEEIVNQWQEKELIRIFKEYGEERFAKRIAAKILQERKNKPIKTTFQLVEIIKKATPSWYHHKKIHCATRIFQALRIAVNDELNNLKKVLPQILDTLESGGRAVIISFHSLEDRIIKNFIKEQSKLQKIKVLTKKPIRASQEELKQNPRARSAKLRAFSKF